MDPQESHVLGERLRSLRRQGFPGVRVTQKSLAGALGVVMSSVSAWEGGKVPPPNRLKAYATCFATPRSVGASGMRVLPDDELTAEERAVRDRLLDELTTLRGSGGVSLAPAVSGPSGGLWRFRDGGRIRIICGEQDSPTADADSPNYVELMSYADADSVVELFGHVRAVNPLADVRFKTALGTHPDDIKQHLVLLGSRHANRAARRIAGTSELRVRQIPDDEAPEGEIFQLTEQPGRTFRPEFMDVENGAGTRRHLTSDVGMFFRTRNPYNVDRTLTICGGVFTRGVYGAVRMFTDKRLRQHNESVAARLFGDADTFGMLVRVPVFDHATLTPDLRNDDAVLYAWTGDGEVV